MTKDLFQDVPSRVVDLARVEETLRTRYWCWIVQEHSPQTSTLCSLLEQQLSHIERSTWPERFNFGGVYINGHAAFSDCPLPIPSRVEYYEPKFDIHQAPKLFPVMTEEFIVYADDDIAVVYKPPHLPSMPAKEQRHFSVKASLEKLLNRTIHMPSRLDVSAQGILIVSTSPQAHGPLQRAFEMREVSKSYRLATASECCWQHFTADLNIARDSIHPVLRKTSRFTGQSALTEFEVSHRSTEERTQLTIIKATPVTGRTHQIRVHAAYGGFPIVGDNFYGGLPADGLHLVSYQLTLAHPITGHQLQFEAPKRLLPEWLYAGKKRSES